MLHFEQLFIAVCSVKYDHYLLSVGYEVGESSRCKHVVLTEIEDMVSKKLGLQNLLNTEDQ